MKNSTITNQPVKAHVVVKSISPTSNYTEAHNAADLISPKMIEPSYINK